MISSTYFFRVDAYPEIGTGHLMRCLALANAAKVAGMTTAFVSVIKDEVLQARIRDAGHALILLPNVSDDDEWLHDLGLSKMDWIILDSYSFTSKNHVATQKTGARLLVIDDMNALYFYQCDILLNQNFSAKKFKYACESQTKLLLGPSYALLRDEFARHKPTRVNSEQQRVLITLGGSDPEGVGLLVLAAMAQVREKCLDILYIAGSSNIHLDQINLAAHELMQLGHKIEICPYTDDMPSAMAWADIGLIAAGSTSLEVVYMGLPCLVFILADNQVKIAEAMHAAGIAESLGWYQQFSPELMADRVLGLLHDVARRNAMTERGQKLVDGAGARRVVEEMLEY